MAYNFLPDAPYVCKCGTKLILARVKDCYPEKKWDKLFCCRCKEPMYGCTKFYQCPRGLVKPHKNGWGLCQDCARYAPLMHKNGFAKMIGTVLQLLIIIVFFAHCNIFGIGHIGVALEWKCFENQIYFGIAHLGAAIGTTATPSIITWLLNSVTNYYSEIQPWQIAYIAWGVSCTLCVGLHAMAMILDKPDVHEEFFISLLSPFGIEASSADVAGYWTIPLVSLAPAIVAGFLVNYMLEDQYVMRCTTDITSKICFDDVCCAAVSWHARTEWYKFIGRLASSMVAAWGVVKLCGYFISKHDPWVQSRVDTKKQDIETIRVLEQFIGSKRGQKMLREHLGMAKPKKRSLIRTRSPWDALLSNSVNEDNKEQDEDEMKIKDNAEGDDQQEAARPDLIVTNEKYASDGNACAVKPLISNKWSIQ